jgi:heat-inducible transcriptional repressor
MEVGGLTEEERTNIESQCATEGKSTEEMLTQATTALSGLAHCAGLVLAPKSELPLKHIELVPLAPGRALVVLVTEGGLVENRLLDIPLGLPSSALIEATNYLNARLAGRSLPAAHADILRELKEDRAVLDELTRRVVANGLASWAEKPGQSALIVRGQAHLLDDVTHVADLERLRLLFGALETKENLVKLLELADSAQGVQIFIGAQNELFSMAGCSAIIAPYRNRDRQLIGAIGIIGPSRINYSRIIPMVDYTAQIIGRLLG